MNGGKSTTMNDSPYLQPRRVPIMESRERQEEETI